MTLIHVGNSSGTVGRCDAKCYDATGPDCDCVCGGRNHGQGLAGAMDNTREHAEAILAEHPEAAPWLDSSLFQGELF
jgi:hypothetical protein